MNPKDIPSIDDKDLLMDNHPDAMAITDLKGNILAINEKLAQVFGKSKEELLETPGFIHIKSEIGKRRRKEIEEVVKNKKPREYIHKERGRWWRVIYQPIFNQKDGVIIKLAYYVQDITEKKEIELNLKKRENDLEDTVLKLSTISENIKIGLYYTDVKGNFLWANKAAADILGKSREEMIGKNGKYLLDRKIISKKDYLKAFKLLTRVKLGKIAGPEIFILKNRIDREKIIEIQAQRIKLHDKNVVVGIVNDITNRKKEELKLQESEEKFKMLSDQSLMGLGIIQENQIKYANNTITQITGYSKKEMYHNGVKILTKIVLPEDQLFVQRQLQKKLSGDKDVINRYSCRIITKTGNLKWVEIFSKTIKYEGKNADFITFIDITEQKKSEQTLKESEQKFRDLAEQSPNMIFINKKGRIVYVNKKCEDIMGYTHDEFLNTNFNFINLISPESHEKIIAAFKQHMNGKDIPGYEYILLTKGRLKLNALITTKLIEYEGESAILGIVTDITKIKKTEELLKNSEEKLRNIIDHSDNLYYIHDTNHKISYVSPQSKKIFGYNQEEMKIKWTDMITDNPINKIALKLTDIAINSGLKQKPYICEAERKDGNKILLRVNESPLKDENGKVIGIAGVITDITQLKKVESEIIRRKDYLQNVIDSISEIILTIGSNHKIKTWNKSAERIIGYKKKDVINKNIVDIDLFEFSSEINNFMKSVINKKPIDLKQINIKTNYGTELTLSVSPSIIKDESDNITEIILICRDITHQKEIKEKLQFGYSYIIDNINTDQSLKIFYELIENKNGIYIGRQINRELLKYKKSNEIQIYKLSSNKDDEFSIINDLEILENIIEKYVKKGQKIIFLDRIDYLITTFTFKELLKTLYKINDLIRKYKTILLVRINSNFLNEDQASLLYEEFEIMPSEKISDIILSDEYIEIINYINSENNFNINVTYGNIGKKFKISKVTVKKRIEYLIKKKLIYSRKIGKTKLLYLTERGKKLISKKR